MFVLSCIVASSLTHLNTHVVPPTRVLQSDAYVLEMDESKITSKGLRRKIDTVSDWHAGSVQQQQQCMDRM